MSRLLSRLLLAACCTVLPSAAVAGVTGTHGPDRGSGGVAAKPKPVATDEQSSEQSAKPEAKKEAEAVKEPNK